MARHHVVVGILAGIALFFLSSSGWQALFMAPSTGGYIFILILAGAIGWAFTEGKPSKSFAETFHSMRLVLIFATLWLCGSAIVERILWAIRQGAAQSASAGTGAAPMSMFGTPLSPGITFLLVLIGFLLPGYLIAKDKHITKGMVVTLSVLVLLFLLCWYGGNLVAPLIVGNM